VLSGAYVDGLATLVSPEYVAEMRWVWLVLGIVLVLVGATWTLQGVGVLGGSSMSNDTTWAVIGPIVAVVGLVVIFAGGRARGSRP
jgi:hypothetical protein